MKPTLRNLGFLMGSAVLAATLARCGRAPEARAPEPTARVVRIVVTATPEPPPQPIVEPALPTPSPAPVFQSAVIEARLPTRVPTIDVASIPNLDRPREPAPESRTEQLSRCMVYSVEPDPPGQSSRLRVRARNMCGFWVSASESWFEVTATAAGGRGGAGTGVGHFQAAIGPNSSDAETFIEVDCPTAQAGGCRYSARVWWAAGGGRKAD